MKSILEKIIRRRNPSFSFDRHITNYMLLSMFIGKAVDLIRGIIVLIFHFRRPDLIFLGSGVSFFNMPNISIGRWTKIDKGAYLSGLGKGKLTLGRSVSVGAYSQIIVSTSFNNLGEFITIGDNVGIGQFASLGGSGGLTIGKNCIIGQYFSCHPENHNYQCADILIKNQGTTRSPIKIGENCWIGAKATILAGVEIGDNCVIAAGAVVTKSMPADSIIGGVPARVLKSRLELC